MTSANSNDIWRSWEDFAPFEQRAHRFRPEMLPLFYHYLGIGPESRILDAGCGTGVFARYLAGGLTSGHATGFDINQGRSSGGCRCSGRRACSTRFPCWWTTVLRCRLPTMRLTL